MFKLLIECTKEIDELHINFSDGTTSIIDSKNESKNEKVEKPEKIKNTTKQTNEYRKPLTDYLDTNDTTSVNQEVIEKPIISEVTRKPNIDNNLQNLDI